MVPAWMTTTALLDSWPEATIAAPEAAATVGDDVGSAAVCSSAVLHPTSINEAIAKDVAATVSLLERSIPRG